MLVGLFKQALARQHFDQVALYGLLHQVTHLALQIWHPFAEAARVWVPLARLVGPGTAVALSALQRLALGAEAVAA